MLGEYTRLARSAHLSLAQLALSWVLSRGREFPSGGGVIGRPFGIGERLSGVVEYRVSKWPTRVCAGDF
jgi:hypothetical protein